MTATEARDHLESALVRSDAGYYRFGCSNGLMIVKLAGTTLPLRFTCRDRVGFRIDELGLWVEELGTRALRRRILWHQVESVAAGEPETSNGSLFQG